MEFSNRNTLLKVNTLASLSYQIITLVCGFILPRLIIGFYGSAANGLVSSITQFLGIIALCELGMGAVVPASLYKPLANKDNDAISKVIVSSEKFYRKIGFLMIIYVIGLSVLFPFAIEEFSFIYTSSLIIIIALSSFAQYFLGITYSLLITADQKQYITYCVNGGTLVVNLILSYILIEFNSSIHIVKIASSIIFIARPVLYMVYVKRHYQLDKTVKYDVEPIRQKWNGVAQHLAYTVQEKTGFVVLSFMATMVEVSIFSIYFIIMEGLRGFIYSVTSSLTSFLGNILAKGEKSTLIRNFIRIEWALHTITVLAFSSAAVLIIPFVKVYTRGITDANYIVPIFPFLMCAAIGCRCLQMPYNIVVQAAGHFKETQNSAIIEPVIDIILSVVLVGKYGLSGVALGMLVSIIYRMLYLSLYLTRHILHNSRLLLFKRLFVDIIMVLAIVVSCSLISEASSSYISWIVMAIKVVSTAALVILLFNLAFYKRLSIDFVNHTVRKNKK